MRWPYWLSWMLFFTGAAALSAKVARDLTQGLIIFSLHVLAALLSLRWLQKKRD